MQRGRAQVPTSIKHRAHHASVRRGESPVPSPDDKGECSFKAALEQSDGQARRGARDRDLLAAARSLLLGDLGDELELLLGLVRSGLFVHHLGLVEDVYLINAIGVNVVRLPI